MSDKVRNNQDQRRQAGKQNTGTIKQRFGPEYYPKIGEKVGKNKGANHYSKKTK